MKILKRILLIGILTFSLSGCIPSKTATVDETTNIANNQMINADNKKVVSSSFSNDKDSYIDLFNVDEVIDEGDYAFIATVEEIGESYVTDKYEGSIFTPIKLTINQALKGQVINDTQIEMIIPYGTVSIKEYEKFLNEGTKQNMGFYELSETDKNSLYHSTYSNDMLKMEEGKQYFMSVPRISPQEDPFIGGANSLMLYEDNKIYNNLAKTDGQIELFVENDSTQEYLTIEDINSLINN